MKKIVRLTESDLVRLVKRVLTEQNSTMGSGNQLIDEIIDFLGKNYQFKVKDMSSGLWVLSAPVRGLMSNNLKSYDVSIYPLENKIKLEKIPKGEINSPVPKQPLVIVKKITDFRNIEDFKKFFVDKFWD